MNEFLTLLPPIVAIIVVMWRKEVSIALILAIVTSEMLLICQDDPSRVWLSITNSLDRVVTVFESAGNTRIVLFSLMIGALMALMRFSGGVIATVKAIVDKGFVKNKRQAGLLSYFVGIVVFVESNLSMLTTGVLSRGLFDRFGISREKLAYIVDSTCAPVCILLCLNGWGAYVLALLSNYPFEPTSLEILLGAIALNFYPILTLVMVLFSIITDKDFGPMTKTKPVRLENNNLKESSQSLPKVSDNKKMLMFIAPLITLVIGMVTVMLWTGQGQIIKGSGSHAIFYATALALCVVILLMLLNGFKQQQVLKTTYQGFAELMPLVIILVLSIALGMSLKQLGTGAYLASVMSTYLPVFIIPALIFVIGALMSFTTGTSWGTFALLVPLGMPIAMEMGLPPQLILAAVLGGGIFGDHCSPLSDSTLMASVASGCDLFEHVKTQLPYALSVGATTTVLYLITGFFI
ncbi:sodium:proton antiporter [Catenovulum sp. SM1970]|uniref:Na+/H+ antiporter NhaC family protein n=1 Tax=Marinifaba aquimaris TaxID=2741323 RepID=UPI001574CC49|nr:Na+/H+ antiporter NhaC family protein [Marinifaba aquimaris]NTS78224.1 sodium:proton antiporter [Marinifaba aquimaris]